MPMLIEDLDQIQEIESLSFTIPWSREAFVQELTANRFAHYITVRDNSRVAAYGGMWLILNEAHITNLAVHPEYRRKGIGKILIRGMIEYGISRKIDSFTLEVRASNHIALKLYEDLGFVKAGIRKGYYSDINEDAIIMWLEV